MRIELGAAVLHRGETRAVMRELIAAGVQVDSVVTDPPYEIGFMGRAWDSRGVAFDPETWRLALQLLKPGGHLLAFTGARTYHRIACAVEDAGFEIRDQIMWIYGSGFPKSLDVAKALDKQRTEDLEPVRVVCRYLRAVMEQAGFKSKDLAPAFECHPRLIDHWAARDTDSQPALPTWEQWLSLKLLLSLGDDLDAEVWRLNGRKGRPGDTWQGAEIVGAYDGTPGGLAGERFNFRDNLIRQPSEAAAAWSGWGTALKPAHEPLIMARKPLAGTVAATVLAHGTGAVNIDGCRVETADIIPETSNQNIRGNSYKSDNAGRDRDTVYQPSALGRFPANLIHDGSPEVLAAFPSAPGQLAKAATGDDRRKNQNVYGAMGQGSNGAEPRDDLDKSAARFFYCAKASKADRGEGNDHPTVKPRALMRYLCRLITPPGGVTLDLFGGSGSTALGALDEGFRPLLIEEDEHSFNIACGRVAQAVMEAKDDGKAA